jgi:hypothetical protein
MDGTSTSVSHTNEFNFSQHPPFVTSCYFVYIMHVPTSACLKFGVSSIVLLEILTPPYYERHQRTSVSHTNEVSFLNTLHLLRGCYFVVHHYACTTSACLRFSVSSIVLLDIDSILWTALSALAYLMQTKFQFLNTSICYELLLCVHHVPPRPPALSYSVSSMILLLEMTQEIMWALSVSHINKYFFLNTSILIF